MKEITLYGVRIDDTSLGEAVKEAMTVREAPCFTVTPNAVMLDACRRNPSLKKLLNKASLSLPDGTGVLLAAKRKGTPLAERVAGIDFGEEVLKNCAEQGLRVFLLGGAEGIAKKAANRLTVRFPRLCICGTQHGYFEKSGAADAHVVEKIRSARPDVLFVCFGFPLQEEWIASHLSSLSHIPNLRLVAALGGSLDVWSGSVRRAPDALSRLGLEWAWRMAREPQRLKHLPAIARVFFG